MKVSAIYGKKVESTAGKTGYVLGINFDGGQITALICADSDERLFTVGYEKIKSIKTKIIYSDGESAQTAGRPLRLGVPVFDCSGNFWGKLTDFSAEKGKLVYAHVGNKKFSVGDIAYGDAVVIKSSARILKSDVKKDNKIIIRRGTPLTPEIAQKAQKHGEYVQTNLKTLI